ncbi:hypothetical protein ACOMHN_044865 [Nucella lapillus]
MGTISTVQMLVLALLVSMVWADYDPSRNITCEVDTLETLNDQKLIGTWYLTLTSNIISPWIGLENDVLAKDNGTLQMHARVKYRNGTSVCHPKWQCTVSRGVCFSSDPDFIHQFAIIAFDDRKGVLVSWTLERKSGKDYTFLSFYVRDPTSMDGFQMGNYESSLLSQIRNMCNKVEALEQPFYKVHFKSGNLPQCSTKN